MAYDWQAEFRRHLVQPNRDLDHGGHFTLLTGGSVILKGSHVTYDGVAAHNIDVQEIFILRSAPVGHNSTLTGKTAHTDIDFFQWYQAAIENFHGIPNTYRPRAHQTSQCNDIYERVFDYLSAKYQELPRPFIRKRNVAEKLFFFLQDHTIGFVLLVGVAIWSALYLLSKAGIITPPQSFNAFFIAHVLGLIVLLTVPVATCFLAKVASLGFNKRLARFVLLTLGNKSQSPPTH
jgi:hypothetical protein